MNTDEQKAELTPTFGAPPEKKACGCEMDTRGGGSMTLCRQHMQEAAERLQRGPAQQKEEHCERCGQPTPSESPLFARVEVFILQCPRCGKVSIAGTWGSKGLQPNENWRPECALWRCDNCKFRARIGLLLWDAPPRASLFGPERRMPDDMVATTEEQNRALRLYLNRYRRKVATGRVNARRVLMGWRGYLRRVAELWGDGEEV